ncbi:NAD(P)H-hydrate dehydratase [Tahibacter amnicola]|uniref:Bifunctional NAD(P)H-hydrate repair enzyme n=1 Tax=Tahibacter amnicola TaxID=2976241 RepID=A0ABY6BBJ1_9GAMM|nr:NAD(P)H-hydrate dehydratase [Tahibacter amnicola]UXI66907.1 NAD(P)H-hydrate dehydratase [Tahibacter amnicola]
MNPASPTAALYTTGQMRRIDAYAIEALGVSGPELMRRAAQGALEVVLSRWGGASRIVVCCGPGKNGGDGYWLAYLLRELGRNVSVIALGEPADPDAAQAREAFREIGGIIDAFDEESNLGSPDIFVDALLGIGLTRPVEGAAALLVERINHSGIPVLALDIPSGLSADTGARMGACVSATATVSFIGWKRGLFTGAGPEVSGSRQLATLNLPAAVFEAESAGAYIMGPECTAGLGLRARDAHKGLFGHVLAIGGDHGMGGAIRLAAEAALRCGAGLVSVATREEHVPGLLAARPELMANAVSGQQELDPLLKRANVIALGPGLGIRAWGHSLWHRALESGKPVVLDADALNLLALHPRTFEGPAVLTPHPGEAARLLGTTVTEIQANRYAAVRAIADRFNAVVVLKGAGSLITAAEESIAVCPWGNPGMASGGMGDVLTGVIAALIAQGMPGPEAARLGSAVHARAGDMAAREGQRGLLASDLFGHFRQLLNGLAND